jgi:hypothetical protein
MKFGDIEGTGNTISRRVTKRAKKNHHTIHVCEMVEGEGEITLDGKVVARYYEPDLYTHISDIEKTLLALGHTFTTTGIFVMKPLVDMLDELINLCIKASEHRIGFAEITKRSLEVSKLKERIVAEYGE